MNKDSHRIFQELEKVPTQVPDDAYFEALKSAVISTIKNEPKVVPFYRKRWIQAAASIVFLLGIGSLFLIGNFKQPTPSQTSETVDFSSLSREDILAYIENHSEDFETEDIAGILSEVPSLSLPSQPVKQHQKTVKSKPHQELWDQLEDDEIIRYLEEESYDLDEEMILAINQ